MSEIDYNARLYEKMQAEQKRYRQFLLRQKPEEILKRTYEYTVREDKGIYGKEPACDS